MTQYANWNDDHVPAPRPHRGVRRPRQHSENPSGRVCIFEGSDRWLSSHTTVEVRP